ncbi:ABC transporter substrate-binding protein [Bauldia litoralis]|uniref:Branched-chain amino acid transport system substrate-binding protein n=1 Tax=Bauldia litoralis TaxID=665467 RepID=A0A1G6BWU5_9HYPH|nr:ABC transporter substrate-binding protein [Bauldia litoralis]SDB25007.1 branched-chain amino acid transport system substrate-binding protein [Bauldia litoralis]
MTGKSGTLSTLKCAAITSTVLLAATAARADMMPAPTVESLTTCDITDTETIKVGIMAPMTGPTAADASDYSRAAGIAIEEINAAGGVCGKDKRYMLEIVEADATEMRNDAVVTAFRRLNSTEDLNVILTPYASTSNFEIDLMAQENMPYLISGGAESTKAIIEKDPDKYPTVWSRVPDYSGYFTDLPPLLNKLIDAGDLTVPAKTVYIIGSDDPYGTTIATGLARVFKEVGWEVVGEETVPFQSVTDWRTQIAKIREVNPAVIVNTEWSASGSATFFNQFFEQPTESLVFLQYAPSIPEFQTVTRNQAVGVMYNMLGGAIDSRDDTKAISAKFAEKYGPGGYFSVAGYNAAQLYALCINQGNDPADRLAIGACFGNLDVDTPSGRLAFDPATHLAKQGDDYMPTLFYQLQEDGKPALIAPEAVAQAPFLTSPWAE